MRTIVLLIALAIALPAAAAPRAAQRAEASSREARGGLLVQKNCGMCHAVGKDGPSLFAAAPPFRELGLRYKPENLAEALAEGIITGHPAMPEFRFAPSEVDDIIHYIKSIQTRQSAAAN